MGLYIKTKKEFSRTFHCFQTHWHLQSNMPDIRRRQTTYMQCLSCHIQSVWSSLVRGLLFKLEQYGISGSLNAWIKHNFKNRQQKVMVAPSFSIIKYINAGVSQGSGFESLFFLIYVNDIAESLESFSTLFADGCSLAISSVNKVIIEKKMNPTLKKYLRGQNKGWLL